jgi:hypothetical protein
VAEDKKKDVKERIKELKAKFEAVTREEKKQDAEELKRVKARYAAYAEGVRELLPHYSAVAQEAQGFVREVNSIPWGKRGCPEKVSAALVRMLQAEAEVKQMRGWLSTYDNLASSELTETNLQGLEKYLKPWSDRGEVLHPEETVSAKEYFEKRYLISPRDAVEKELERLASLVA